MAQKFIGLDDAATQLGATKEQLNSLREAGELRAYRDGASWKFRTEDIDALAESGKLTGGGDALGEDLSSDESLDLSGELDLDLGSLDLSDELGSEPAEIAPSPESDLELAAVDEPTVAAEEDELVLDTEASDDDAESILLTDASVGSGDRPPSTIIGKSDALSEDDDLELAPDSKTAMSDVKLVSDDEDSLKGLSSLGADAASGDTPSADAASNFEGLEELEIDLEAESSRILEAEDVQAAKDAAAKQANDVVGDDDRPEIDALDSDFALAPASDAASLTGLSQLGDDKADGDGDDFELAADSSLAVDDGSSGAGKKGPGSSAVLTDDADDDFVLGGEGSDVTLSGADSGINLVPSDSGIALDDASLDLSGAGSSLDLSESFGAALTDGGDDSLASAEVSGEQDFLLQPVADDESEMDEDSSQIIALEEVGEDDDEVMISDDVGFGVTDEAAAAASPAGTVAAVEEAQFDIMSMGLLTCSVLVLVVCSIMSVDMIRTIWSWNEPSSISSSILESVANLIGYRT